MARQSVAEKWFVGNEKLSDDKKQHTKWKGKKKYFEEKNEKNSAAQKPERPANHPELIGLGRGYKI